MSRLKFIPRFCFILLTAFVLNVAANCINDQGELDLPETRRSCYEERCRGAQANCVTFSAFFSTFFTQCSDWQNQPKSVRDNIFYKINCDPAWWMIGCADAHERCTAVCNEEFAF